VIEYHKNFSLESLPYINLEGLVCWEEFRDIPDYEGLYQVSDLGRVKTFNYKRTNTKRILKLALGNHGYFTVGLYKNKKPKLWTVHQLVAIAFLNHKPCGYEWVINHKNFTETDNRLTNLEIVTARTNCNKKHLESVSKYTGVTWDKKTKLWKCQIGIGDITKCLGYFNSEEEASEYYENAVIAIKNGTKIKVKEILTSSKYRGVTWNKSTNSWVAQIVANGIKKNLGYFDIEEEASQYYENALLAIQNGTEIKVKRKIVSSKYKGVSWNKSRNKWKAEITINGKSKYIASFNTEIEAHEARENYKKQIIE